MSSLASTNNAQAQQPHSSTPTSTTTPVPPNPNASYDIWPYYHTFSNHQAAATSVQTNNHQPAATSLINLNQHQTCAAAAAAYGSSPVAAVYGAHPNAADAYSTWNQHYAKMTQQYGNHTGPYVASSQYFETQGKHIYID